MRIWGFGLDNRAVSVEVRIDLNVGINRSVGIDVDISAYTKYNTKLK